MENLTEEEVKKAAQDNIEKIAKTAAEQKATEAVEKSIKDKGFITKEDAEKATDEKLTKSLEDQKDEFDKEISKLSSQIKKYSQITPNEVTKKSYDQSLRHGIVGIITNQGEITKEFVGQSEYLRKALEPVDFGSVENYTDLNTDRSLPMYANPYAPVYLRNIFPNVSTTLGNIAVWKRTGFEGAAAIWARGTGDDGATVNKPEVKAQYTREFHPLDWVAGTTDVPVEMVEDSAFLQTEIPYTLIYSESGIYAAENKMILDYIDANAVDFSKDAEYPVGVEKILAAAFGQLGDRYMTPTHILINNWDYLYYMTFNKADGSGEYVLPGVELKWIGNQLFINNLIAVPIPDVEEGAAFVVAAAHSRFVNRMEVRLRQSEHTGDNFKQNMVTYRAEERVTFYTNDQNSLVKVALPEKSTTP